MEKIEWCRKQKLGIKRREPSINLSNEYLEKAEESLRVLASIRETKSNMWIATTRYYIEYFAVYAFLMRVGIKCEIHDCTIELVKKFENHELLEKGTAKMLEEDKELRIDNQYYLKNRPVEVNLEKLREFVLSMKSMIDRLTDNDVEKARSIIG